MDFINSISNSSFVNSTQYFANKTLQFATHVIQETGKGLIEGLKLALSVSVILITAGFLVTFFSVASMTLAGIPIPIAMIFMLYKNALIISTLSCTVLGAANGFVNGVFGK